MRALGQCRNNLRHVLRRVCASALVPAASAPALVPEFGTADWEIGVENGLVATKAKTAAAERAAAPRVGAAVVALFWAVLFFGIIDLMVAITPSVFP